MFGDRDGAQVRPVNVDGPELAHPVRRVRDGVEVLGETRRGHQVVDLGVVREDVRQPLVDGGGGRYVHVVCCDLRRSRPFSFVISDPTCQSEVGV